MLTELRDLLDKLPDGTPIPEISKELGLSDDRKTTFQLIGAIRLEPGFGVRKTSIWNKESKTSSSLMVLEIKPKS